MKNSIPCKSMFYFLLLKIHKLITFRAASVRIHHVNLTISYFISFTSHEMNLHRNSSIYKYTEKTFIYTKILWKLYLHTAFEAFYCLSV